MPATWPILIGPMNGQNGYKWNPSGGETENSHLSTLFYSSVFFFMFNFSLFSFSYLVCKRPHSPSLVSHNDSFDSFKEDVWDDYAYQRGTFVAKLETI
jgi:hypothetical protein